MNRYSAVLNCALQVFLEKNSGWTVDDVIHAKKQGEKFVDNFLEFYYQIYKDKVTEEELITLILNEYNNIQGFKASVIYETLTKLKIAYEKQDVKLIKDTSEKLKSIIAGMESCKRLWEANEEEDVK